MSEYACTKCMWVGKKTEDIRCPECNSKIEYVPHELDWKYHQDNYSWNKK